MTDPGPRSTAVTGGAGSRNLGLDLLRLVAIVLVIGNHFAVPPGGVGPLLTCWIRGGWVGVDLFFVLSGFLVTGLLFKEHQRDGRVSISRFFIRRGLKIYPAFWVLIVVSLAVFAVLGGRITPWRNLLGELLFVQNYAAHIWAHTWSLAIEEHFYLCLVLLIWLLVQRPGRDPFSWLPGIFAVIATACLGLRWLNALRYPQYNYSWDLVPTHLRIDSLFFGALLAYLAHYRQLLERLRCFPPWGRVAMGAAMFLPAFCYDRESERWVSVTGFTFFYLGSGLLVLGAIHLRETSSRVLRLLAGLGAASYSIYLWHLPVNVWIAHKLLAAHPGDGAYYRWYLAVCVFGALAAGYAMARAVELPILRIRDRLCPAGSGPVGGENPGHISSPQSPVQTLP